MDIDKKDGVLDGYYSKALPDDDLSEGCYRFSNKHGLWAMINGYEEYARGILNTGGYPLTMKELWAMRKGLKKQIRDILDMFFWFENVRREVEKNDAKMAAFFMAHAIHSAMKARIEPMEPLIKTGIHFTQRKEEAIKEKILKPKKIREAFAKQLIDTYPLLSGSKLGAKITSRAIPYKHEGTDYKVYRISKKGRSGKMNLYIRFETAERFFDYEMENFFKMLRKSR